MKLIESNDVKKIFYLLNEAKIDYILLRNINNELPNDLQHKKDIDLLVKKKDNNTIKNFFYSNEYIEINHPLRSRNFLYGADKFKFIYNKNNNIIFDLSYQITVTSLNQELSIVPLDKAIQESAWKNKRLKKINNNFSYWTLSYEDEFVSLISRSIFDKKSFLEGYIKRINKLYDCVNKSDVLEKLNLIYFKFTPYLITFIENKRYNEIIEQYLEFKEY